MADPDPDPPVLSLRLANGEEIPMDITGEMVLELFQLDPPSPGYSIILDTPFIYSERIFTMVRTYAQTFKRLEQQFGADAAPAIAAWERDFIAEQVHDADTLYDLFLAATTMRIDGLTELCAQVTADAVKGRTADQVKWLLGIPAGVHGMSPEEELALREDNEAVLCLNR